MISPEIETEVEASLLVNLKTTRVSISASSASKILKSDGHGILLGVDMLDTLIISSSIQNSIHEALFLESNISTGYNSNVVGIYRKLVYSHDIFDVEFITALSKIQKTKGVCIAVLPKGMFCVRLTSSFLDTFSERKSVSEFKGFDSIFERVPIFIKHSYLNDVLYSQNNLKVSLKSSDNLESVTEQLSFALEDLASDQWRNYSLIRDHRRSENKDPVDLNKLENLMTESVAVACSEEVGRFIKCSLVV